MNQSIDKSFRFFKQSAKAMHQLHTAVLLSPLEVDAAFKRESEQTRGLVAGHWMLTGVVNPQLFSALRLDAGRDITGELGIIRTPAGAAYLIVCSELGARQHRHVLPLYEGKVTEFLTYASGEPFRMALESTGEGCERMLYTSPLFPELFVAARDACQEMDRKGRADFVQELPRLIAHVMKLETMPGIKSQAIREVDVSVLLPYEAAASHFPAACDDLAGSAYCH